MSSISETDGSSNCSSTSGSDPDFDVDDFDVTLKLGGVESTLGTNGIWRHNFPSKNPGLQKLSNCRTKMQKLVADNEKLRLKFDLLFNLAKNTSTQFEETQQELKQLRKIWKQTKMATKSRSKSKSKSNRSRF